VLPDAHVVVLLQTLRGTGGDIIWLEEAAFIKDPIIYEVVLPLITVDTTALIGISTPPSDPSNYYSRLFDLKGLDDKPMFDVVTVEHDANASMDEIAPWKSADKMELIQKLYAMRKGDYEREMLGVRTTESNSVFHGGWITAFLDNRHTLTTDVQRIYIGIDPNGGGASQMCAIAVALVRGVFVIVDIFNATAQNADDVRDAVIDTIDKIREHPRCKNANIILLPENNLGHEASHIEYHVRGMRRVHTFSEKPGTVGVCTTHKRKAMYVQNLQAVLSLGQLAMVPSIGDQTEDIGTQLRQFARQFTKTGSCTYSGKDSGNDDAVMALMIAIHWAKQMESGSVCLQ